MTPTMPLGSLHSFKNAMNTAARMIISVVPAGLERMFFEVGVPEKLGETPPPPSKAEIEKLLAVAMNYGVKIRVPQKSLTLAISLVVAGFTD